MPLRGSARTFQEGSRWSHGRPQTSGRKRYREGAPMNHKTPFRLRRTIVLGLVVATALVTTSAAAASAGQPVLPPGATVEPFVASAGQPVLPPGATVEPFVASAGQPVLPPGAPGEPFAASAGQPVLPPGATVEPVAASAGQPGGVQVAPALSSPVVEGRGGLDW